MLVSEILIGLWSIISSYCLIFHAFCPCICEPRPVLSSPRMESLGRLPSDSHSKINFIVYVSLREIRGIPDVLLKIENTTGILSYHKYNFLYFKLPTRHLTKSMLRLSLVVSDTESSFYCFLNQHTAVLGSCFLGEFGTSQVQKPNLQYDVQ